MRDLTPGLLNSVADDLDRLAVRLGHLGAVSHWSGRDTWEGGAARHFREELIRQQGRLEAVGEVLRSHASRARSEAIVRQRELDENEAGRRWKGHGP